MGDANSANTAAGPAAASEQVGREMGAALEERELPKFPSDAPHVAWLRPGDIAKPPPVAAKSRAAALGLPQEQWSVRSARRGALIDSDWFLSAMCCVAAAAPQTLRQMFQDVSMPAAEGGDEASAAADRHSESAQHSAARGDGDKTIGTCAPRGLVSVRLFRDGNWVTAQIDDRLPCSRAAELLAPQCESEEHDGGKLWPALAEKALAALVGGYDKVDASAANADVASALVQITGGQVRTVNLASPLSVMWTQNGYLWSSLKSWCAQPPSDAGGLVVVCLTQSDSRARYGFSDGLQRGLAYPVAGVAEMKEGGGRVGSGRLVRVANPWGPSATWRGTMANGSPEWETLRLKDAPQATFGRASSTSARTSAEQTLGGEDGGFWMLFEDWVSHFSTVHVCSLVPQGWHTVSSGLKVACKVYCHCTTVRTRLCYV